MEFLTKEFISRLIFEEVQNFELSEMALNAAWAPSKLPEQLTLNVDSIRGIPVNAVDSNTGEPLEPGTIKSNMVRTSPTEHRLLQFMNLENGKRETRYVEIDGNGNAVNTFKFPPRLEKYGTAYGGPVDMETKVDKRIEKLQKRQKQAGWDKEDEYQRQMVRGRLELSAKDEQSKRKLVHPIINKFFGQKSIITHLDKCGIPELKASSTFTEPTTNINVLSPRRDKESKFCGPDIYFNYHTVRDDDDIQDAIDKIINYRASLEMGEKPKGKRPEPGKMVRQYAGQVYSGGQWSPEQRAYDKPHFELTPIYKLYKQAVQKGEKAFNVISDLTVMGKVVTKGDTNSYVLTARFSATNSVRTVNTTYASTRGNLFNPITVGVEHEMGDEREFPKESMNCIENTELFKNLYIELFQKLTDKILEIEPDAVLEKLLFEPSDVTKMD
jgi:hypothetical protein